MKIQVASDLHLEFYASKLPPLTAFRPAKRDVLVLAGDIGRGLGARNFVLRELTRSPVIYVPGNHEYYGMQSRMTVDGDWRRLAAAQGDLHYLVGESVEIDGIRFWGSPWYSDLWGAYRRQDVWEIERVRQSIHDFQHPYNALGEWSVRTHVEAHERQTGLLEVLAGRVDVVVTHWPPTLRAVHPRFHSDALNCYFYNEQDALVREIGAQLWISGHTHEAWDCRIAATRCLGNPTGYPGDRQHGELFRPDLVVEVERCTSR